jgi:hypothetical protein
MGLDVHILPTSRATIQAIFIGLFIPSIASILPIQKALSKSISDSMNTSREQTKGIIVSIIDN